MTVNLIGTGEALIPQFITVIIIILSIELWLFIYKKAKIDEYLNYLWPSLVLWMIFGTLDSVITAAGTYGNASAEGNPATRFFLENFGIFGMSISIFLWIAWWACLVGIILYLFKNYAKKYEKLALFFGGAIFYSLAMGNLWGFSTWVHLEPIQTMLHGFYGWINTVDFWGAIIPFWSGASFTISAAIPGIFLTALQSIVYRLLKKF